MKNRLKLLGLLLPFIMIIMFTNDAFSYPADVTDISGKKYYPAVKKVLDGARKSVFMVMYIVDLDVRNNKSLVNKLCQSLVNAKKRGVKVKVILDQNIDYRRKKIEDKWQIEGKNENAIRFFKKNDIDVFYDDINTYSHNKAIVVDGKIVVLGSTNWTNSALSKNNESSVLIESEGLAKSILKDFAGIAIDQRRLKPATTMKTGTVKAGTMKADTTELAIYRCFLENENLAGRMITQQDERSFDLYLLLLNEFKGNAVMEFDYSKMAKYLDMDKKMSVTGYRRQLIKTLRKLEKRYRLIKSNPVWGKKAGVTLLDIKRPRQAGAATSEAATYKYPQGKYFILPGEYFSYGWYKKLSFSAKYCYFITLYEVSLSKTKPWWSGSQKIMSLQYHLSLYTIAKGMTELRRLNIIDIEYSSIEKGYDNRKPNTYKLLSLYSPEKQMKEWKRLEKLYGKDKVKDAKKFAKVVFKENDLIVIEDIIHLIEAHGKDRIQKAFDYVSKKAVDNPRRTYKYVVGILKGNIKE